MPKAEAGSVKDIAKRIKSKGLQKLKFFCQMCQKQCRDANGFQCHLSSDSHLRQMKIFSENASGFIDEFSREFETMFLETLRRRHGTAQVNANNVYQQVIQDKVHVHMNATQWTTLTDFCKYLGKTGKCKVEQNERGWFIRFIERDAAKLARQEALEKRLQAEQRAEDELHQRIQQQRLAAAQASSDQQLEPTKLADVVDASSAATAVSLNLGKSLVASTKPQKKTKGSSKKGASLFQEDDDDDDDGDTSEQKPSPVNAPTQADSVVAVARKELPHPAVAAPSDSQRKRPPPPPREKDNKRDEQQPSKHKKARQKNDGDTSSKGDRRPVPWLYRDIVVRIIKEDLQKGRYFKRKAVVDRVVDCDDDDNNNKKGPSFAAELIILADDKRTNNEKDDDSVEGDVVRLDQDDLETVIPKSSDLVDSYHRDGTRKKKNRKNRVCLVRGKDAGEKAKVLQLDKQRQEARLELLSSSSSGDDGTILKHVAYEDFSKIMSYK